MLVSGFEGEFTRGRRKPLEGSLEGIAKAGGEREQGRRWSGK